MTEEPDLGPLGAPVDAATFNARMHALVPLSGMLGIVATRLGADGSASARLPYVPDFVRPGGSVSGPAMMALADVVMFAGVNGRLGWTPMALTANLSTTFLSPPRPEELVAEAVPLRFGRRLAVYTVSVASASAPDTPVAHITGSYALPKSAAL